MPTGSSLPVADCHCGLYRNFRKAGQRLAHWCTTWVPNFLRLANGKTVHWIRLLSRMSYHDEVHSEIETSVEQRNYYRSIIQEALALSHASTKYSKHCLTPNSGGMVVARQAGVSPATAKTELVSRLRSWVWLSGIGTRVDEMRAIIKQPFIRLQATNISGFCHLK